MPNSASPLVVIMAYDQLCTFEFGCAFEVFGLSRPEMGPDWYRCLTAAAEPEPIRAAGGLRLEAAGGLELLDGADTIIIPGWRGPDAVAPPLLLNALRRAHATGIRIVSICGAAFVLAQAGLLAGKRATTHWRHASILASRYPDIVVEGDALYVDEGDILTSAGSAAGLDLCLHIVRKDFGAKAANSVARRLVIAAHRDGGQSQFIERSLPAPSGARLSELLETVQKRIGEKWSLERMAEIAHVSVRTVHRHIYEATGLAPGEWIKRQRIAYARDLLEETTLSVDAVAQNAGFGTTTNFRQHFRTSTGFSPANYRSRFQTHDPVATSSIQNPDTCLELISEI
ncbi:MULTISPECIES: transcriptional regulator FtrA [Acetobacteraceae]|uniref:Transcriptional regulator FtrA n=3 Tax=Acetobacteraceae TaxID=433 RepID=A0A850P4P3_9PROT|nr:MULTISPECIES: transcriptional regulator FtrA [Acetobacteraceae]MBB2199098.1 transcriptional regulator FtrA [Gluconacetobacter dulcium]NVN39607.1 transcriptional regulator FtrA [Ameyamaea chiangmaiensis]